MAITALNSPLEPFPYSNVISVAGGQLIMNSAGEQAGYVFEAPKTGNIATIRFFMASVTTGDTVRVSLQDMGGSGVPDDVADQSTTVALLTGVAGWYLATLGSSRAVTRGDRIAVVFDWDSYVAGNVSFLHGNAPWLHNAYCVRNTGGGWIVNSRAPVFLAGYDDGSYAPILGVGPGLPVTNSFTSASTPDEMGNIFQLPVPTRIIGAQLPEQFDPEGDPDIVLYGSDGSTVLETISVDSSTRWTATQGFYRFYFSSDHDIIAATNYRIVVKPSASSTTLWRLTVPTAASLGSSPLGTVCHRTERTDAGAWSETTTEQMYVYPILAGFDDGAGGGGGLLVHPGMNGGINA